MERVELFLLAESCTLKGESEFFLGLEPLKFVALYHRMMKDLTFNKIIAIFTLLGTLAAPSLAQKRIMINSAEPTGFLLLSRDDVRRVLSLTPKQIREIENIEEKCERLVAQSGKVSESGSGGAQIRKVSPLSPGDRKKLESMRAEGVALLDSKQAKRLREINIQLAGPVAATFPLIKDELGVTQDQLGRIEAILAATRKERVVFLDEMRNGKPIDMSELQQTMSQITERQNKRINEVLSDKQKEKLKALAGEKFEADPDEN